MNIISLNRLYPCEILFYRVFFFLNIKCCYLLSLRPVDLPCQANQNNKPKRQKNKRAE